MTPSRLQEFDALIAEVQACRCCSTMEGRRRVLSRLNGQPGARVMFIAEAPGRNGGEVTGVPLSRDPSGQRFTRLLGLADLDREQVFITNAVLCNPRAAGGVNRPPSRDELENCSGWLARQISVVDAPIVVTRAAPVQPARACGAGDAVGGPDSRAALPPISASGTEPQLCPAGRGLPVVGSDGARR
jgi:hypothetical protein